MWFFIGEISLFLAVMYFCWILLTVRNPLRKGWFTASWMVESVHIFFLMGFGSLGICLMIYGLTTFNTIAQVLRAGVEIVVVLLVTAFIIKSLRIKERLAAYDALIKSKESIETVPASPPDRGLDDHPPVQKAA